jgi:hypothetical protein
MKTKKARKRLRRVEDLLTNVIEKYKKPNVHELLGAARLAVTGALTKLPKQARKPVTKAAKASDVSKKPMSVKPSAAGVSRIG